MKVIIITILILAIFGCSKTTPKKISNNSTSEKLQYSDSLLILYTVKSWHDSNWYTFENYSKTYKISNSDLKLKILKIFYNSNHTKFLCWIGEEIPNAMSIKKYNSECYDCNKICPLATNRVFSATSLVGFRTSNEKIWEIFPFDEENAVCASSYNQTEEILSKYFFEEMKNDSKYVNKIFLDKSFGGSIRYDLQKKMKDLGLDYSGPFILKNYGYNLQDKGFWEKSLIWQKGAVIPGYYDFQTRGNVLPDDKDFELIRPEIRYPECITKLYK